jgi:hypothetical protein
MNECSSTWIAGHIPVRAQMQQRQGAVRTSFSRYLGTSHQREWLWSAPARGRGPRSGSVEHPSSRWEERIKGLQSRAWMGPTPKPTELALSGASPTHTKRRAAPSGLSGRTCFNTSSSASICVSPARLARFRLFTSFRLFQRPIQRASSKIDPSATADSDRWNRGLSLAYPAFEVLVAIVKHAR